MSLDRIHYIFAWNRIPLNMLNKNSLSPLPSLTVELSLDQATQDFRKDLTTLASAKIQRKYKMLTEKLVFFPDSDRRIGHITRSYHMDPAFLVTNIPCKFESSPKGMLGNVFDTILQNLYSPIDNAVAGIVSNLFNTPAELSDHILDIIEEEI